MFDCGAQTCRHRKKIDFIFWHFKINVYLCCLLYVSAMYGTGPASQSAKSRERERLPWRTWGGVSLPLPAIINICTFLLLRSPEEPTNTLWSNTGDVAALSSTSGQRSFSCILLIPFYSFQSFQSIPFHSSPFHSILFIPVIPVQSTLSSSLQIRAVSFFYEWLLPLLLLSLCSSSLLLLSTPPLCSSSLRLTHDFQLLRCVSPVTDELYWSQIRKIH